MATLRDSWSNKILHLSSFISRKKNDLLIVHGLQAFISVFTIIGAEILLLTISLPSYLAAKDIKNTSDNRDKENAKEYHLRRALTLGTISTILIIWVIKLLLILFLVWYSQTYGTLKINQTNNPNGNTETLADDVLIAGSDSKLLPPQITNTQNTHTSIYISGNGVKNDNIVFAFSDMNPKKNSYPKIYTTTVDTHGKFNLVEDKNIFNLPPGRYSVSAITYDPAHQTKSATSTTFNIAVSQSFTEWFVHIFDVLLNIIALIAIIVGVLTSILVS